MMSSFAVFEIVNLQVAVAKSTRHGIRRIERLGGLMMCAASKGQIANKNMLRHCHCLGEGSLVRAVTGIAEFLPCTPMSELQQQSSPLFFYFNVPSCVNELHICKSRTMQSTPKICKLRQTRYRLKN